MNTDKIRVIAFDADDTLWDNQTLYDQTEARYCQLLEPYGTESEVRAALYEVEKSNMPTMGYGTKAFVLSLLQNALEMSHDTIDGTRLHAIIDMGQDLLRNPATPLEGVTETLGRLHASGRYRLVCLTKGDLLDQENKLERSGLRPLFDHVEIVSEKGTDQYISLCRRMGIEPTALLMVGNSFKSDIHPVLELGGYGIHIPYKRMWQYELFEEYEHDNMLRLQSISQLPQVLGLDRLC